MSINIYHNLTLSANSKTIFCVSTDSHLTCLSEEQSESKLIFRNRITENSERSTETHRQSPDGLRFSRDRVEIALPKNLRSLKLHGF